MEHIFGDLKTRIQKALAAVLVLLLVISSLPSIGMAQDAGAATSVPIWKTADTSFTSVEDYLKNFTLDRLATMVAKQILHQMTVSVVNWINRGFKGSPAFLTNPEGFFRDAADQVTGAFIAGNGPLSQLCSPFAVDIRIALSLGQSSYLNRRYTCTLGTIINNFQNIPNNISVNGRNISGFMNGDFSQGGWPAFIALTTQPQNNAYGAFLQSQSDLQMQIASRQAAINNDLNRGNGFMSFQDCKDVPISSSAATNANASSFSIRSDVQQNAFDQSSSGGNLLQSGVMQDAQAQSSAPGVSLQSGVVLQTQQVCETQTPGSVIANTLQKQLDVPATELELANSINSVIDALVSQLVTQMLNGGLNNLSNGNRSYTSQLDRQNQKGLRITTAANFADIVGTLQNNVDIYDQAIGAVEGGRNAYEVSRACFSDLLASSTGLTVYQQTSITYNIASIDSTVASNVDSLIQLLMQRKSETEAHITRAQELFSTTTTDFSPLNTDSTETTQQLLDEENAYLQSIQGIVKGGSSAAASASGGQANQDLQDAKKQTQAFIKDAQKFGKACKQVSSSVGP